MEDERQKLDRGARRRRCGSNASPPTARAPRALCQQLTCAPPRPRDEGACVRVRGAQRAPSSWPTSAHSVRGLDRWWGGGGDHGRGYVAHHRPRRGRDEPKFPLVPLQSVAQRMQRPRRPRPRRRRRRRRRRWRGRAAGRPRQAASAKSRWKVTAATPTARQTPTSRCTASANRSRTAKWLHATTTTSARISGSTCHASACPPLPKASGSAASAWSKSASFSRRECAPRLGCVQKMYRGLVPNMPARRA